MSDIEARIAELFHQKITSDNQVIVINDVDEVIEIMGQPEEFIDSDADDDNDTSSTEKTYYSYSGKRRIYRDTDQGIIGGVCAGLSNYLGWDPLLIRILFAVAFMGFGFGFLLYLFLMIIIPEAKTAAEKLEMKGDPINVENIGKKFEETLNDIADKATNFSRRNDGKFRKMIHQVFGGLAALLGRFFEVFGKIIGIGFILFSLFLTVLLLTFWISGESLISVTSDGIHSFNLYALSNSVLIDNGYSVLIYIGITLVTLVPIIALLIAGIKLLFDIKGGTKGISIALLGLWLCGLTITAVFGIQTGLDFSREGEIVETLKINQPEENILYLTVNNDKYFSNHYKNTYNHGNMLELIHITEENIHFGYPYVDIKKSKDSLFRVEIEYFARGATEKKALSRADNIDYSIKQKDSLFVFNPYYSIDNEMKIRGQEVAITVFVPQGGKVFLSEKMKRIIYDIKNTTNMHDDYMIDHMWLMTGDGLSCVDCD